MTDGPPDAPDEDLAPLQEGGWRVVAFTHTDHFAVERARARWSLLFEKNPRLLAEKRPAPIGIAIVRNGSVRRYAAALHRDDAQILMDRVEPRDCRLFCSVKNEAELYLCCCDRPPQFDVVPRRYRSCFISHSSKDKGFAGKLCNELRKHEVSFWQAVRDATAGEEVLDQLGKKIKAHERFLLCYSRAAMESQWVTTEITLALTMAGGRRDRFIVLNLEAGEPDFRGGPATHLSSHVFIDVNGWENEECLQRGLQELLRSLKVDEA